MLHIDGSRGEGGGQILRTSLALSILTQRPIHLENIRKGRSSPGLKRQHLECVRAAAAISNADVEGDHLNSTDVVFTPGPVQGGSYAFDTQGAGSTSLVWQTVLYPLLLASRRGEGTSVVFKGGTHNPWAPPFPFLQSAFLPKLHAMGVDVELDNPRLGFYPKGGGELHCTFGAGADFSTSLELTSRPKKVDVKVEALVMRLPDHVAERELQAVQRVLGVKRKHQHIVRTDAGIGEGNAVVVHAAHDDDAEVFVSFGERGKKAEHVATKVAREAQAYLKGDWPVGEHRADQLMLPLLFGGGVYRTGRLSLHSTTQLETIRLFTDVEFDVDKRDDGSVVVENKKALPLSGF